MEEGSPLGLPRLCVLLAAVLAIFPCCSQGNWMWLGIASFGVPEKLGCANLPLSARQKDMCKRKPYLLSSIREGARLGIQECKNQFRHERWNCSVSSGPAASSSPSSSYSQAGALFPVFGYEMTGGTKETAFIYAVTAAGLVHSVTRSCSAGNMTECSCDASLQNGGSVSEAWHWGGCSDDIQYGMWFSKRFLDGPSKNATVKEGDGLAAMNLHNSEAGRQAPDSTTGKIMILDQECPHVPVDLGHQAASSVTWRMIMEVLNKNVCVPKFLTALVAN